MNIAIVDGHPDPAGERLCHGLARAYAEGAEVGGHPVRQFRVADMDLPLLRTEYAFKNEPPPPAAKDVQDAIGWADHLVLIYPLWLGTMPAALKALLEQSFRPDFAMDYGSGGLPKGKLANKSARIVVTMGMPALAYRWWFGAHSLKNLERNILKFCGITPVRSTLYGMVGEASDKERAKWLAEMRKLGGQAR